MTTIKIQVDPNSKSGKALLQLVEALSNEGTSVKVISQTTGKSPYNAKFVSMVKKAAKEPGKTVTAKTLWQDLGL